VHAKFWLESVQAREDLKDLDIGGRIILKSTFSKFGGMVWTRFVWLRMETSGWFFKNVVMNVSDKRQESF
jgi:hypothetical protein